MTNNLRSFKLSTESATLYVKASGPPEAPIELPPVVVLHGGGMLDISNPSVDHAFRLLSQRYATFTYARRGYLPSPSTGPFTIRKDVDDLRSLCEQLAIHRPLLFAISWGGVVALAYAAAYPDAIRGVILEDTIGPPATDWLGNLDPDAEEGRAEIDALQVNPGTIQSNYQVEHAFMRRKDVYLGHLEDLSYEVIRPFAILEDFLPLSMSGDGNPYPAYYQAFGDRQFWTGLRELKLRALIIKGPSGALPLPSAAEWRSILPLATIIETPNMMDFPHVAPGEEFFLSAIHSWVTTLWRPVL